MITEYYVSFDTAKLLKEKGFEGECFAAYNGNGKLYEFDEEIDDNTAYWSDAPTLQMAMRWLIQEHKLYVNVVPSVEGYYWTGKWHSYVEAFNKRYPFGRFIATFESYEQACEAAIKYCLENLI